MDFCTERMDDAMHNTLRCMKRDWQLYLFLLVPVAYILIFAYYPMLGIQIAFKDYSVAGTGFSRLLAESIRKRASA